MHEQYTRINLREIRDSHFYDIHPFLQDDPAPQELVESVLKVGILHPPAVIQGDDGSYDVIYGRQRLKCSETVLQEIACLCRIIPKSNDHQNILTLLLEDQFYHNNLSIVEQACFLKICMSLLPEMNSWRSFLQSIPQTRIQRGLQYLIPFTSLNPELQRKFHQEILSEKIITDLQRFNDQDQQVLIYLIEKLHLGANNQKKLLQLIHEVLKREDLPLSFLLADQVVAETLAHPRMNDPQKTIHLFDHLQKRCYPLLSAATDSFQREIGRLQLPDYCKVQASQSFEKDEVTLSIRFHDLPALKNAWQYIQKNLPDDPGQK